MPERDEIQYTVDGKEIDFFGRTPAGYALTQTPKKFPWDKPPKYSDPDEAYNYIMGNIFREEAISEIVDLLEMDVPPTLIAQSIVNMGFSKGLFNPDIAELIKPSVAIDITLIGSHADVDINFGDNPEIQVDYKKQYLNSKKKHKKRLESDEKNLTAKDIKETLQGRAQKAISGLMSRKGE